jgi:thiol:disulfide interchange protein DsbD
VLSRLLTILLCLVMLSLAPLTVLAKQSAPVVSENITARLVADRTTVSPGGTVTLAFAQEIREGWHTYWRNPGDSGAPASLAWELPDGVEIGPAYWPAPEAIPYFGLMTYGHHDQFVLLQDLTVPESWPTGTAFPIRLAADWLVCAEICIPETGTFALDLPVDSMETPADPAISALIETAEAALPRPLPWPAAFTTVAADDDTTLRLVTAIDIDLERLSEARFFPYQPGLIDQVAEPAWQVDENGLVVDLVLDRVEALGQSLEGVLVLTEDLPDGLVRQAFTVAAPRDPGLAQGSSVAVSGANIGVGVDTGLLEVALLALLGGLLLNLMPCVFPVLSIKALALVEHAGSPRAVAHGLAYTAGVLTTFLALAGLLIALQASGALIGWGFQLQEPLVVAFLAYLMFGIGLWLIGGVEATFGRLSGVGQRFTRQGGLGGSFATGGLAVLVASPCTAPFMAGAIGFALTREPVTALAVFAALGLGLALPYLVLSITPWLQRRLPRPGTWMTRFRQLMAFPMFATAAWLVWVLARQVGDWALLYVLLGFVALALAFWAFRLDGRVAKTAGAAFLAMALTFGILPGQLPAADPAQNDSTHQIVFEGLAEPFSSERLAMLRAEGRPVLVNMTAAWCLTCLVNERAALTGKAFEAALARNEVAYLKGDWTRRDPSITDYLTSFARAGVPLYVLYPASGAPVVLPQLLTEGMIEDALDEAGSSRAL